MPIDGANLLTEEDAAGLDEIQAAALVEQDPDGQIGFDRMAVLQMFLIHRKQRRD